MSDFEPTPLEERMALHVPGQISWPEPKLRKNCIHCRHFLTNGEARAGYGTCDLVYKTSGTSKSRVTGKKFNGHNAQACMMFTLGSHELNE
jgi:hypothetical protein